MADKAMELPSVGRMGEIYYDDRNNRIKFFSEDLHNNRQTVDELFENAHNMMVRENATRINARFIIANSIGYDKNVEAKIPLNGGFSGYSLYYLWHNQNSRIDRPEILSKEDALIAQVLNTPAHHHNGDTRGYLIERLSVPNSQDVQSLLELYNEAFTTYTSKIDRAAVETMMTQSLMYGVRHVDSGQIVSAVVAERSRADTSRGAFKFCELSEMATRRGHRGKGLVTLATQELVRDMNGSLDLIYAEARSCHLPINQSFHNMGFSFAGRLNKQCILSGDHEVSENGPYENLNVWYVLPTK